MVMTSTHSSLPGLCATGWIRRSFSSSKLPHLILQEQLMSLEEGDLVDGAPVPHNSRQSRRMNPIFLTRQRPPFLESYTRLITTAQFRLEPFAGGHCWHWMLVTGSMLSVGAVPIAPSEAHTHHVVARTSVVRRRSTALQLFLAALDP